LIRQLLLFVLILHILQWLVPAILECSTTQGPGKMTMAIFEHKLHYDRPLHPVYHRENRDDRENSYGYSKQ
jgi:hypothetical protein